MTVRIFAPQGHQIRQSRNLRGLLDHARRNVPQAAALYPHPKAPGFSLLIVTFDNGDTCASKWADWRVCADWLAARRSWGLIALTGPLEWRERYDSKARKRMT